MIRKWYFDDRVLVPGNTNKFLNLASPRYLNDIVYQIVYGIAPLTPTGPLLFQNGLNSTITSTNYVVELGGTLIKDTTILGNTSDFRFTNLGLFQVDNSSLINIEALLGIDILTDGALTLKGETQLNLQTAAIGVSSATNGQVLTLTNDAFGTCDWADSTISKYTQTFVIGDWSGNDLTISVGTHGRGTKPLVQVKDSTDQVAVPGITLGIPTAVLYKIRIPSNGDVTISAGSSGPFDGEITII